MSDLISRIKLFRDERDWTKFHTPKNLAVSISIEASELLEVFQWSRDAEAVNDEIKEKASDEIADVYIYLLYLCDALDVDLEAVAQAKMERNEKRFPVQSSKGIAKPKDKDTKL